MKITFGIVMILIIGVIYWYLHVSGIIETIFNHQNLETYVLSLGSMGPLIIILLMTIAIVISPLPSAPIALISGAVTGLPFLYRFFMQKNAGKSHKTPSCRYQLTKVFRTGTSCRSRV